MDFKTGADYKTLLANQNETSSHRNSQPIREILSSPSLETRLSQFILPVTQ